MKIGKQEWKAKLHMEVDDDGNGKLQVEGKGYAIISMIAAMMFKDEELRFAIEEAVAYLQKNEGDLQLLDKEADHGEQTIEEFAVFWAKVEDRARSVKHIFKSDYYKYKDAINELAKEMGQNNWLIQKSLEKIASYSQEGGD